MPESAPGGDEPAGKRTEEAAALDKMTDVVEERELRDVDNSKVQRAMAALAEAQRARVEEARQRERELAAVKVPKEAVDAVVGAFEVDRKRAERVLREHGGHVAAAVGALLEA